MAERISWSSFPRLRDYDAFDVVDTAGTPGQVGIRFATAPSITWWKSVKLVDRASDQIVWELQLQDANHGPASNVISAAQATTCKLVIAKAKIFGIHTDMYEIYDVGERLGRNISLTWRTDGPDNAWDAIGSFFTDVVNGIADAAQAVAQVVVEVVTTVVTAVTNAVAWVAGLVLSLPVVGRAISLVIHGVEFVVGWIANAAGEIVGAFGARPPQKLLRLQVVIQRDELSKPVASVEEVRTQIDFLVRIFQERANIKVIPGGPFRFTTPFSSDPFRADEFITILDRPSMRSTLDVRCGGDAFLDDFGSAGASFQLMMNNLYWGNTARLAGVGAPIVAFAVRSFASTTPGCCGSVGCSLGPAVDYVTVKFQSQYSTLAHEVAHACALMHADGMNLMNATSPSPVPPGDFRAWLTDEQVFLLRSSPRTSLL